MATVTGATVFRFRNLYIFIAAADSASASDAINHQSFALVLFIWLYSLTQLLLWLHLSTAQFCLLTCCPTISAAQCGKCHSILSAATTLLKTGKTKLQSLLNLIGKLEDIALSQNVFYLLPNLAKQSAYVARKICSNQNRCVFPSFTELSPTKQSEHTFHWPTRRRAPLLA